MKRNILFLLLGMIVSGLVSVVALSINSNSVDYNGNVPSKTNVKDAVDEIYKETKKPGIATGRVTISTSSLTKVTLGFKPKYLSISAMKSSTGVILSTYNADVSTTTQRWGYISASDTTGAGQGTLPHANDTGSVIKSIDSDGFTLTRFNANNAYGTTVYYFAIGE